MKKTYTLLFILFFYILGFSQDWQWTKIAGGPTVDKVSGVATDLTGNIFITGYFDSTIVFDSIHLVSAGGTDVFVAKYDADGVLLWAKQVGGQNDDYASSISTDMTGNCYISGFFFIQGTITSFGNTTITQAGDADMFISKLSAAGNLLWVRNGGGKSEDAGYAVATDISGNSYITGYFSGNATFGNFKVTSAGYSDVFIAKYDAAGNLVWVRTGGGAYQDEAYGICVDASGNCYITGYFTGNASFSGASLASAGYFDTDALIAKYNPSGVLVWIKRMGGTGNDIGYGITVTNTGQIYVGGVFHGTHSFGDNSLSRVSGSNGFLAKLDLNGKLSWSRSTNGNNLSEYHKISADAIGNCYVVGSIGMDASIEKIESKNAGGKDVCVAKYDSKGTLMWVLQGGGSEDDYGISITSDAAGNCYIGGQFENNATFGKTKFSGWGMPDIFISRIK